MGEISEQPNLGRPLLSHRVVEIKRTDRYAMFFKEEDLFVERQLNLGELAITGL
jgi:hypothetical protein